MPRYTDPDGFPEIMVLDSIKRGSIDLARVRRSEPTAAHEAGDISATPAAPDTPAEEATPGRRFCSRL